MADQLFDDYGIGTGSPNLFSGGMSKQELDELLGQFTPRTSIAEGLVVDRTADRVDRGGSFPYIPFEKEPEGLIRILNQNTGKYELKKDPNFIPYNSSEYWAMMQADADQVAANGISQTQLQTLSGGMKTDDPTFALDQTQPSAPTSVMGMFPEVEAMQRALYQQKQNEAMQAQALQFARLDPFEKASYGLAMGGQQLGNAIGGALGAKDPQMQMIGLQSRILSELIPGNPAQNIQIAQKYARFAPELAMKINNNALDQLVKMKQASSASKLNITAKVQEADAYALKFGAEGSEEYNNAYKTYLQGTEKLSDKQAVSNQVSELKAILRVLQKQPQPNPEAIQRIQDQIQSLEPDKQNVAKIGVAKASGKAVYFDKETDQQFVLGRSPTDPTKQIRVLFEGDVDQTTSKVTTNLPGVEKAGDLVKLRNDINATLKSYRDAVNAADQAIELADDVLKTGNFASAASLSRSLAKASGETQLSKQDVAAFGGDPSFVGSISDIASRLGTGTPTADTTRKLRALAVLLKKKNEALEKNEIKQLQTTARISGLYTEDQIKQVFTLRGESKAKTRTTAGGISYTVDEEN